MTPSFYLSMLACYIALRASAKLLPSDFTITEGSGSDNLVESMVHSEGSGDVGGLKGTVKPLPSTLPGSGPVQAVDIPCSKEYASIKGHTMCLQDSPEVTSYGVTSEEEEYIVSLHNKLRGNVHPPASDLVKLTWDRHLAAIADKWARQCQMAHDEEKSVPGYGLAIGQNVAGGYRSWKEAIMGWYNEVNLYRYGLDPEQYLGPYGWKEIGHYTQIVHNATFLIGCGYANCPMTTYGRIYVCNYASGQGSLSFPYTRGRRCSACPRSCVKGQCDCGGKVCFNGGSLDRLTCSCRCTALFTGPTCHDLTCPEKDSYYCGRSLFHEHCKMYVNVPELCPFMCGICGAKNITVDATPTTPQKTTTQVTLKSNRKPAVFVSEHGCKYSGRRATTAECRQYGEGGNDMDMCASMGGAQVTCHLCTQFYNIKTDYCPVMCGLCDPPCGGKRCLNGGKLDTATCQCTCKQPFEGITCQTAVCPARDPRHCMLFPVAYCSNFINVPSECPFLCGICR